MDVGTQLSDILFSVMDSVNQTIQMAGYPGIPWLDHEIAAQQIIRWGRVVMSWLEHSVK
jgi:hypothetical protein